MRGGQPEFDKNEQKYTEFTPHARGQPHKKIEDVWAKRFTPHARGSTQCFNDAWFIAIILPACAGVNLASKSQQAHHSNSPRMRGGQPEGGVRTTKRDGILPARAGVNLN